MARSQPPVLLSKSRKGWNRDAVYASLKLPRFVDMVDDRESQIIVAALHCIAEMGIAGTTTRAVARRADVNQGAIHYYFGSKDAVLQAVLKRLWEHKALIGRTIRESQLTPTQKIYCLLRSGTDFMRHSEEVIATVSLWGHAIAQGGVWCENFRNLFYAFRNEISAIVDEGIACGEFREADSKAVADTLIVSIWGIGMHYLMIPQDFAGQPLVDRLVGMFFRILDSDGQQ